jgi:ABC-type glycerol-3-phosphate transport system permease component
MYACLVICLTPIAVFYIFAQRFLIRGMTVGAVKG